MGKIDSILTSVLNVINSVRTPPPEIPKEILGVGSRFRPGLSPALIAAKIISRQHEAGAPTGVLPSGNKNIAEAMEVIRVEEIINAILQDARIDIAVDPGIIVNAGGTPGLTVGFGSGKGIIR